MVAVACAASAGAHAGLVPEHLREAPQLGFAFAVAVILLCAATVALSIHPSSLRAALGAALLLATLIASYAASRTTGIPLLQPQPEPLDTVGLATKVVEGHGLVFALYLTQPAGGPGPPAAQEVAQ